MKKCKHCKEPFKPLNSKQKHCLKKECVEAWVLEANKKAWNAEKKRLKEELETVSELTKKTQKHVNDYIRERDRGKDCISCDKPLKGKFDAGHYFESSRYPSVRFDESNIHGQCVNCNKHRHGNLIEYQVGIEKRIGGVDLFELHQKAHEKRVYTKEELREITEEYKKKKKDLQKQKKELTL